MTEHSEKVLSGLRIAPGLEAFNAADCTVTQLGGRAVIYKAMCDLLWTLWGLIQHADDIPAEDFWTYATTRFGRCKTLMQDPGFDNHVTAVWAG